MISTEDVIARVRHPYVVATAANLGEIGRRLPDLLAGRVEVGSVVWTVPSKRGHLVVVSTHTQAASLGYERDECIMLGELRVQGNELFLVEARSGQAIDLNQPRL